MNLLLMIQNCLFIKLVRSKSGGQSGCGGEWEIGHWAEGRLGHYIHGIPDTHPLVRNLASSEEAKALLVSGKELAPDGENWCPVCEEHMLTREDNCVECGARTRPIGE